MEDIDKSPIYIYDYDDFNLIKKNPSGIFIIKDDIDAEGKDKIFIHEFKGILDGNNHVIENLHDTSTFSNTGLVNVNTGTICNLHLRNFRYKNEGKRDPSTSGMIAYQNGKKVKENNSISNKEGKIINCSVEGRISNHDNIGGIVGINHKGDIINCASNCILKRCIKAGGIAAKSYNGEIKNCWSTSSIVKTIDAMCGGILGVQRSDSTVKNCHSNGEIHGGSVGGIVGENSGKIKSCSSSSEIYSSTISGGLVSKNSPGSCIGDSIFNGNFVNEEKTLNGSLLGKLLRQSKIENCYYVKENSEGYNLVGSKKGTNIKNVEVMSNMKKAKKNLLINKI